jgi:hypothetical protein
VRTRGYVDLVVLFVLVSAVFAYLLLTKPGWHGNVLRVYVFVVGALLLAALIVAAGDTVPRRRSEFSQALRERQQEPRLLPELETLQREVSLSTASAFDFHMRLRPQLREIAQARLERTGRTPGPDTLGRWWELLRPDREPPQDRFGSGMPLAELRALVDDLERLA